jgi:YD repeat-containing protein
LELLVVVGRLTVFEGVVVVGLVIVLAVGRLTVFEGVVVVGLAIVLVVGRLTAGDVWDDAGRLTAEFEAAGRLTAEFEAAGRLTAEFVFVVGLATVEGRLTEFAEGRLTVLFVEGRLFVEALGRDEAVGAV